MPSESFRGRKECQHVSSTLAKNEAAERVGARVRIGRMVARFERQSSFRCTTLPLICLILDPILLLCDIECRQQSRKTLGAVHPAPRFEHRISTAGAVISRNPPGFRICASRFITSMSPSSRSTSIPYLPATPTCSTDEQLIARSKELSANPAFRKSPWRNSTFGCTQANV